jgi:hypothetical protein
VSSDLRFAAISCFRVWALEEEESMIARAVNPSGSLIEGQRGPAVDKKSYMVLLH